MVKRFYTDGQEMESFLHHKGSCLKCRQYDKDKTATLALLCVKGSELIKFEWADAAAPIIAAKKREETKKALKEGWIKGKASKKLLDHVTKWK